MNFLQQVYKGKNDWWRWLIILLLFLIPVLSNLIKDNIIKPLLISFPEDKSLHFAIKQFKHIILLVIFLLLFKVLHKRKITSLITSRKKIDLMRFGLSFSVWGVFLMLVFSLIVFFNPDDYKWNFQLVPFLKLFAISVTFLPFRIFFIIILSYSYILQAFTLVFKKPWFALLATVFFFTTIMYIGNTAMLRIAGNQIIIHYLATSFLLGIIVVLDDGIEIALGMLLVTSLISKLFITYTVYKFQPNSILIKNGAPDAFVLIYIICMVCYPLYFYFMALVYKWKDWKHKLFNKIER